MRKDKLCVKNSGIQKKQNVDIDIVVVRIKLNINIICEGKDRGFILRNLYMRKIDRER